MKKLISFCTALYRLEDAETAIETAVAFALVMVILVVGFFEFAFGYWIWNSMQLAAAEGARYAIGNQLCPSTGQTISGVSCTPGACIDPTDASKVSPTVKQVVLAALPAGNLFPSSSVTVTCNGGTTGCRCKGALATSPATLSISVTYSNNFLTMFGYNLGAANTIPMD